MEDIHRVFTGNKSDKILGYLQRFPAGARLIFTYAAKNPGMFIEAMPVTRLLRHNKNVSRHRLDIARLQTLLQDHNPGQDIGAPPAGSHIWRAGPAHERI